MDCFAALAMTAACCKHNSAFSRRIAPELCTSFRPKKRAQGMPGAGWHPRSRVQYSARDCAHEHTGTAGAARHSLRDGFTAYTALSLETNSFCLHRRRIEGFGKPGWISQNLRRLDASNGRQDHTALPSASTPFVGARLSLTDLSPPCENLVARPALCGHRSPHPTSVTIAIRPSCERGMGGVVRVIWGEREAEYFLCRGLDRF